MLRAPGGPLSVDDIKAAVVASRTPEELHARLATLLEAGSPGFEEILARAMFTADVLGFIHAREE